MAFRLSGRIKLVFAAVAALSVALLSLPSGASAAPQSPPSAGSVEQQLTKLALRNTMLIEQFDQAQVDVQAKQAAAAAAQRAAQAAQAAFENAGGVLGATATAQYESGSFSSAGALLSSDSGQSYLDQLTTLQVISTHTAQVVETLSQAQARAEAARKRAATLLASATAKRDALANQRAIVQKQVDTYTTLLATLSTTQQTAFQQAVSPAATDVNVAALIAQLKPASASGRALTAVKFALAQVGKWYSYGSAGPTTFDCSGLTMASWSAAGVSLPHSSEQQFTMGTPVTVNNLKPGDLLFFYGPPPGHVTIYIGGGLMVSAPQTGEQVKIVKLSDYNSSYVGARRVG